MNGFIQDIQYALRGLLKSPGFTAVAVVTLALGIGANTAVFSGVNTLLFKTLPVHDPHGLVRVRYTFARSNDMMAGSTDFGQTDAPEGLRARATLPFRLFRALRDAGRPLVDLAACAPLMRINVVVDGAGELADGFISTGNFYDVLGVTAAIGRTIGPGDDTPSAPPVAVISHQYWQARFHADPEVVGRVVTVGRVSATIVGVLPETFIGVQRTTGRAPDIAFPLALDAALTPARRGELHRLDHPARAWLQVMGRVKDGVTARQVETALDRVFRDEAKAGLDEYLASLPADERFNARNRNRTEIPALLVDSGARGIYRAGGGDVRTARVLAMVVALVLAIVCANLATLLLARGTARQKEMAIRMANGGTRARVVRQLLTESMVLAAIGGAVGVFAGYSAAYLLPGALGAAHDLDWRLLAFAAVATTAVGVGFGALPAFQVSGVALVTTLKEHTRSASGSRSLLTRGLVVAQVALSLFVLVGAALLLQTVHNLRSADVGFDAENLVLLDLDPGHIQYEPSRFGELYEAIAARLRTVPGVTAVTFAEHGLLTGAASSMPFFTAGSREAVLRDINRLIVSPGFFETMGVPILAGRPITATDDRGTPRPAVINEAAAQQLFGGGNPLGLRFGTSIEKTFEFEVVGVARDAKYSSVREPAPPTMYVTYAADQPRSVVFDVRTAGDPTAMIPHLREAVRGVQPDLPLTNVTTQAAQIDEQLAQERALTTAYTGFGLLALAIASMGLFGLLSYAVTWRTKEMGIRLAIGAQSGDVLWMVLRDALGLVAAGVLLGVVAVFAGSRVLATLLYGVETTDVATIAAATLVIAGVSLATAFTPARRAARVDPIAALRAE